MFIVRYQTPYNSCEWRTETFNTFEEAESRMLYYISCGSPAHMI